MPSIVFESIGDEYCWGNYAEFRVLIMRENGYINATKLCKDGGKSFKHWNDNQESNDLIKELASSAGIPTELISIKNMKGSYELRGTYVHRDLVPNIASWISPSFSLKVSRIVNEYLLMKEKEKHAKLIAKKNKEIEEKDDKIDELKAKLDAVLRDTGEILDRNKDLKSQVSDLTDGMTKLSLDNEITHEKLENMEDNIELIIDDRVVRPKNSDLLNTVIIYESIDKGPNKFYMFRVQKRGFGAALKRYKIDNPNAVKFAEIEYNPNAINYYARFKEKLEGKITWEYNTFTLITINRDDLRDYIHKINAEKYELEFEVYQ